MSRMLPRLGEGATRVTRRLAPVLVVVALLLAVMTPLWTKRALPVWDAADFYYPAFVYVSDSLSQGRFPFWDPYTNCGEPFFADPQKAVLNPVLLVLAWGVGDTFLGFVAFWFALWAWAGAGMVRLAKQGGASGAGALLAGVAYVGSGFFVGHAEHIPYLSVAAWLPWILSFADEAVQERRAAPALLAASAFGFSAVSGGYPMLVVFTGLAVALWLVLRHVAFAQPETSRRPALAWVAGTLAAMAVLLVVAWAPVLWAFVHEAASFTTRLTSVAPEVAAGNEPFSARAALSLLFPRAVIEMPVRGVEMSADISMTNAYVGFATVPLAVTWLLTRGRGERRGWLAAFVAVMVLVSLGRAGGVRWILNAVVPPLRLMRFSAPFRLFWILPVCLAAGLGLTCAQSCARARRHLLIVGSLWAVAAAATGAWLVTWLSGQGRGEPLPADLWIPTAAAAPIFLVILAWHARPAANGSRAALMLTGLVIADSATHVMVNRFTVWSPEEGRHAVLAGGHVRSPSVVGPPVARRPGDFGGPFNAQLLVKEPVVGGYTSNTHQEFNGILARSPYAEVLAGRDRFWLAPGVEAAPARPAALATLANVGAGDPMPALVEAGAGGVSLGPRVAPGSWGNVVVASYAPESITLHAYVPGKAPALLAGTERWAPGWKVLVDQQPAEVLRVNLFFRAVIVPPGLHKVDWRYDPEGWWPLVALSTVVLLAAFTAAIALERRRPPRPS